MSDDELREQYWGYRAISANCSDIGATGGFTRRGYGKVAAQQGRALKAIDIIVGIARQRGISLARGK